MKKLGQVLKIVMILFVISVLILLIVLWKSEELEQQFINIAITIFMFTLALLLIIGTILSLYTMYKHIKNDPKDFIKTLLSRFIMILLISCAANYWRDKELDLEYSLIYSIMLTISSFYLEDRYIKD